MFLAGLISGIIISALFITFIVPKMLFSINESKFDFSQTAELLTESVKNKNWKMTHEYDLQQIMTNNGFSVRPVKVFSICKPGIAVRILDNDKHRHISAMMPCRVAIYEKADGKTYISRMNAGLFAQLLGGKAKAIMGDAGEGSENIIQSVIKL